MNVADEYIYRVYVEKSFTSAAKKLFISQPSLSAVIANKEREVGFQIFDRRTKPISLTPEGHIYVEMLEEVIESEKNMRLRVDKLNSEAHNSIGIGGNSSAAHFLIPAISGAFKRKYPQIEVRVDIGNYGVTSSLSEKYTFFQKIDRGELDAIFCYKYDPAMYSGHPVYEERLVVGMHHSLVSEALLPYAMTREELFCEVPTEKRIREATLFSSIPFLHYPKSGAMAHLMSELMSGYIDTNYKIVNSMHGIMHFNMMCAGVGALLMSDILASVSAIGCDDIRFFVFDSDLARRNVYLATKKELVGSSNVRKFIDVAKKVCEGVLPASLHVDAE